MRRVQISALGEVIAVVEFEVVSSLAVVVELLGRAMSAATFSFTKKASTRSFASTAAQASKVWILILSKQSREVDVDERAQKRAAANRGQELLLSPPLVFMIPSISSPKISPNAHSAAAVAEKEEEEELLVVGKKLEQIDDIFKNFYLFFYLTVDAPSLSAPPCLDLFA